MNKYEIRNKMIKAEIPSELDLMKNNQIKNEVSGINPIMSLIKINKNGEIESPFGIKSYYYVKDLKDKKVKLCQ